MQSCTASNRSYANAEWALDWLNPRAIQQCFECKTSASISMLGYRDVFFFSRAVDVTFLSCSINKLIDVFPINMRAHQRMRWFRCGDPYGSFSHDLQMLFRKSVNLSLLSKYNYQNGGLENETSRWLNEEKRRKKNRAQHKVSQRTRLGNFCEISVTLVREQPSNGQNTSWKWVGILACVFAA